MYTNGKWNDHQKTQINPYVMEVEESFLWNTGSTSPSISVNPTVNTTYWVNHTLGTETITEEVWIPGRYKNTNIYDTTLPTETKNYWSPLAGQVDAIDF